jgi:signal transduction histidine kinase/AraC-like DNA-binding protein/ActR/RegA family two-component response regulator/ligand-binding sensor domain-containing protein
MRFIARCLLVVTLLSGSISSSYARELGRTRIDYFSLNELGVTDYNYGIAQDANGRIWVANERPLLMFDGIRWQAIKLGNQRTGVHSPLPYKGRVYGSAAGEIGYVDEPSVGQFVWHGLNATLPQSAQQFDRVTGPVLAGGAIWYLTDRHLLRLANDGTVLSMAADGFGPALSVVGEHAIVEPSQGSLKQVILKDEQLQLTDMPWPSFGSGAALTDVTALANGAYVYMSAQRELTLIQGQQKRPFAQHYLADFAQRRPICMLALRDGGLALGFIRGGVWVFDDQGELQERFDETSDAKIGSVSDLFEDREQGIWVSQVGGIARIDRGAGLTHFGIASGLVQALSVVRHQGTLYTGGRTGVFQLQTQDQGRSAFFKRLEQAPNGAAQLLSRGARLWAAGGVVARMQFASDGAMRVVDHIEGITRARRFAVSKQHPDRIYVINIDASIEVLDQADSDRPLRRHIAVVQGVSSRLVVTPDESLWLNTVDGSIWRIWPDTPTRMPKRYTAQHGLPSDGATDIFADEKTILVTSDHGILAWDAAVDRFQRMPLDGPLANATVTAVSPCKNGDWFVRGPSAIGIWRRSNGRAEWDPQTLSVLSAQRDTHDFLLEENVLWIARSDGLERLLLKRRTQPMDTTPKLSSIVDSRQNKRLFLHSGMVQNFDSQQRDLTFSLALPIFSGSTKPQFRTRLFGYDQQWSAWSERAERGFTNLPDGTFRFAAQVQMQAAQVSELTPLTFSIAPPWWRTTSARIAYLLSALFALISTAVLATKRRTAKMQARQWALERTVAERTAELAQQNVQLAQQALQLKETDRLKTQFFVNVGHEFRSPLTLVLGPLQNVLSDHSAALDPKSRADLEMADRNARRVLELIVELMDINRLEHGRFSIRRERLDFRAFVQRVVDQARPLADRFGHELSAHFQTSGELLADFDPVQIERCIVNLVGNAAKYMSRGGHIDVLVDAAEEWLRLSVRDQGRGISPHAQPHVFDRFFQVEGSDHASGYGIGLALVRELVEGHDGSVRVDSDLGKGSVFTITLPRFAAHAADKQTFSADVLSTTEELDATQVALNKSEFSGEAPLALIVDDHADIRAHIRRTIDRKFRVIEAVDGPSAEAVAAREMPDIIVSDVMMPGFDGVELARRLRANPSTEAIGLILLTAKVGSEHAVAGLNAGANDYLAKPFDASELIARMDALMSSQQRLRQRLREGGPVPQAAELVVDPPAKLAPDAERFLGRLHSAIEAELGNPDFGVDELANKLHLDRSSLFRRVKDLCGAAPSDLFREARLQRAKSLLLERAGNVSEVAYAVGYNSLSSFTRAFKAKFGQAPSDMR